jgi:peptidoglycan/xylan/chitin deacetylase (PgdA/CDA1 family)
MLPDVAKTASSCLLHWAGVDRWRENPDSAHKMPVVLGYHRVVEDFQTAAKQSIPAMLIDRKMFERHLDLLTRQYRFVSLDEVAHPQEGDRTFDRPEAAITFDDGYRDVYEHAFPILARKGIPAAVFVITKLVGTRQRPLHDTVYRLMKKLYEGSPSASWVLAAQLAEAGLSGRRLSWLLSQSRDPFTATRSLLVTLSQHELLEVVAVLERLMGPCDAASDEETSMDWDMIRKMQDVGFTIGSHTQTHALLTNENCEQTTAELKMSRFDLESNLRQPVRHLAYPDGRFNADVLQAAAAAGYHYGYTTCRHRDPEFPRLTIGRTVVWQNSWLDFRGRLSVPVMSCHLGGVFDLFSKCRQDHAVWNDAPIMNPEAEAQLESWR